MEQSQSVKYKMVNLISAVRTLMRSKYDTPWYLFFC